MLTPELAVWRGGLEIRLLISSGHVHGGRECPSNERLHPPSPRRWPLRVELSSGSHEHDKRSARICSSASLRSRVFSIRFPS